MTGQGFFNAEVLLAQKKSRLSPELRSINREGCSFVRSHRGQPGWFILGLPQSASQSRERRALTPPARLSEGYFMAHQQGRGSRALRAMTPQHLCLYCWVRPVQKTSFPFPAPVLAEQAFPCPSFPDQAFPGHWATIFTPQIPEKYGNGEHKAR